jgi:hypothetical protein
MLFIIITFILITSISYLDVYLILAFKISLFSISIWVSYFTYFSLGRTLFFCHLWVFNSILGCVLFVISFTLLITLSDLVITLCLLSKNLQSPILIWERCFTYLTLGYILFFTACKLGRNSILCCTHTTGSSISSSLFSYCWDHASSPKVLQEETASTKAAHTWCRSYHLWGFSVIACLKMKDRTDLKMEWPFSP